MALDSEQRAIVGGIAPALIISIGIIALAVCTDISWLSASGMEERLRLLALALIFPAICLIAAVGRMGNQRFREPLDRNAAVAETCSPRAEMLQAILRNTHEQAAIAFLVYTVAAILLPHQWLDAILYCSCLFLVGRIAFTFGYARGAGGRALGFGLTFYPSILLLLLLVAAIFV